MTLYLRVGVCILHHEKKQLLTKFSTKSFPPSEKRSTFQDNVEGYRINHKMEIIVFYGHRSAYHFISSCNSGLFFCFHCV